MKTAFEKAFAIIIGNEGKYSNNPNDAGGETMYGITEKVARNFGYVGEMKDMPLSVAHKIYRKFYWDKMDLDIVSCASFNVALEMFDTGVNTGCFKATKILQRSLNVLNYEEKLYPDLIMDELMGEKTISALEKFIDYRKSDSVLYKMMNCLQGAYYVSLAEYNKKDEDFIYGWFDNRVKLEANNGE